VFVLHLSLTPPAFWLEPDGEPVLEMDTTETETGVRLRVYDTRFKNWVERTQYSKMEIQELSPDGSVLASHRSETSQRWIHPNELELLLRLSGFSRWTIHGDFDRRPLDRAATQMVVFAWRDR
jgi:hypothetical protein